MNTSDLKSFYYLENGEVSFTTLDTQKTVKQMDAGYYNITYLDYPASRVKIEINQHREAKKIHHFPDRKKLDELFEGFFNKDIINKVYEIGFYHKVGVLLYGKEGTGKSTILRHYFSQAIKNHGAIVFNILRTDSLLKDCWEVITKVRTVQDNPIIILLEELDQYLKGGINEGFIKTMLDGNMSINNCIFLATTNYLDAIPDALKNRPSRFKYAIEVEGIQNPKEVEYHLQLMIGNLFTEEEIVQFADELKGNTIDHIKQFCLDRIMSLSTYKKQPRKIGFIHT